MYMDFVSWYLDLDLCHFMCNRFGFRFSYDEFKDAIGLILRLSGSVYGIIYS